MELWFYLFILPLWLREGGLLCHMLHPAFHLQVSRQQIGARIHTCIYNILFLVIEVLFLLFPKKLLFLKWSWSWASHPFLLGHSVWLLYKGAILNALVLNKKLHFSVHNILQFQLRFQWDISWVFSWSLSYDNFPQFKLSAWRGRMKCKNSSRRTFLAIPFYF